MKNVNKTLILNNQTMKNYKIACSNCGNEFTSSRKDAKYCSDSCRVTASRERKQNEITTKTSVFVKFSDTEYSQLGKIAKSAGISVEDMVKYRSLVSLGDIGSKEKEITALKEEVIKLKAHLSVYTKKSASGIFLPVNEDEKEFLKDVVKELKPGIDALFPDDNDTEPFESYLIYILKNAINLYEL